ncbi:GHKL domain-containing protein [uncultured Thomasclavelia sp.]|jgi:hypothetical protein|uniref:sensor histidine kinase n=1 Tax=uncultured Thomasclavelia sp. TaxID=3025759 RepID=UPI00280A732B|nr:GHKL domain-containing protein [uncultured Thomasclavelia sp.]
MWSLIENAASLVECIIITGFTTLVLGYKNPRHKYLKYIIYTLAVFIDCIFLVNYLPPKIAETFPGILQILISFIYALLFLQGTVFLKCYISFISNYMIFLINIPVMLIFSGILNSSVHTTIYMQGFIRIVILVLTKVLYFLLTFVFYKWYKHNLKHADFRLNNFEWFSMLLLSAISFAIGLYIFQTNINQFKPIVITVSSLAALAINALVLHCLLRSAQNRYKAEEIKFYQLENQAMKTNLDNYIKQEAEISKIKHDMENVALTTTTLLQEHDYAKLEKHFSQIINDLQVTDILHTDIKNVYLNAIIQQKYTKCKSKIKNVNFTCAADETFRKKEEIANIDIIDLCTIIANLLDNAIEAYTECNDYDIRINLDYINNSYRIEISNTIKGSVLSGNKTLKTSKSDTKNHGIGIKSVKSRAEKYNGKTEFTEENGQFVARVWLMA